MLRSSHHQLAAPIAIPAYPPPASPAFYRLQATQAAAATYTYAYGYHDDVTEYADTLLVPQIITRLGDKIGDMITIAKLTSSSLPFINLEEDSSGWYAIRSRGTGATEYAYGTPDEAEEYRALTGSYTSRISPISKAGSYFLGLIAEGRRPTFRLEEAIRIINRGHREHGSI